MEVLSTIFIIMMIIAIIFIVLIIFLMFRAGFDSKYGELDRFLLSNMRPPIPDELEKQTDTSKTDMDEDEEE